MKKKTWDDFRDTGLLCFVNTFLHMFGWAIVVEKDDDNVEAYPARVNYTGFSEESYEKNYEKVRKLLNEDISKFDDDTEYDDDDDDIKALNYCYQCVTGERFGCQTSNCPFKDELWSGNTSDKYLIDDESMKMYRESRKGN